MAILSEHFRILQYCGVWLSIEWNDRNLKKILYHLYTCLVVFGYFSFCASCVVQLFKSVNDIKVLADSGVMSLTFIGVCLKMINLITKRLDLLRIFEYFEDTMCLPRGPEEKAILEEYRARASWILQAYGGLVMGVVASLAVNCIVEHIPAKTLPFNGWLPFYDYEYYGYWCALLHQNISDAWGAAIGCTFDSVIYGMLLQICSQFNVLKYRIGKFNEEILKKKCKINDYNDVICDSQWQNLVIRDYVNYHQHIFKISKAINDVFSFILFTQFSLSVMILTVTIQAMSKLSVASVQFVLTIAYLSCMLGQIFLLCWYGNEVKLNSSDVADKIYTLNWPSETVEFQKNLLIFMPAVAKPMVFKSGHIVSLTLNSFNNLLRTSYSAYNLLSQITE